jgi:Zn-dependent protease with chaperone function
LRLLRCQTAFSSLSLLLLLLAGLMPASIYSQSAPHSGPAQASSAWASPAQNGQSYSLPPDKLAKATTLGRIRPLLHFGGALWGLLVLWLLLATRTAAWMESSAQRLAGRRWMQGIIFFMALQIVLGAADLPLSFFGHSISLHYGISVQGWASWCGDLGKAMGLSILFATPILLLFNWIVRVSPQRYWLWAWIVTLPLMVLSACGEPLIAPLFNQFEPLSKSRPELVEKLEKVAARTGTKIPPERIFLMKASVKTNALNAYVSGMGQTKRIVVWDTTAGRIPDDEVLFIFGHESGHYVLNHIVKGLAGGAVFLFFLYWLCARFAARLAVRMGSRWGVAGLSSRAGFVVLLFTVTAAQFLLEPIDNLTSRHFEHEADIYGQEAIHGIVADPRQSAVGAFNHLGEAALDDPNPNPFVEFWTYSHPSIQRRARFAAQYDPWAEGGKPKFFR